LDVAGTNSTIIVDQDGDGTFENATVSLFIGVQGEGLLSLANGTGCQINGTGSFLTTNGSRVGGASNGSCTPETAFGINLTTLAKEFDEAASDEVINIHIQARTGNEIGIATFTGILGLLYGPLDLEENEDLEQALSGYGVFLELFDPTTSDEAEDLTIEYPLSQRGARVFVTGGLVSTSSVEGGVSEKVQALPVGVSKLASEVSDITQYNAIVVGGPCANPISAQLMGNPEPCWESITNGVAKLFEHANGNVALLAAGRTGQDTRRVARALATGQIASVNSKEASISGTTLTDITVRAA
jgi:hypothetical protein